MKISIVADLHINKSTYKTVKDKKYPALPFRTVDFMKSFNYIVKHNIEKIKPEVMVIAGDVFDNHLPSNEVRSFVNAQLQKLVSANIYVIILVGNHDVCKKHHALSPLKSLKLDNVNVIEEPTLMDYKDKVFLLFPYSLKVEKQEISIKDQFHEFIESSKDRTADKESFFFGHFGVKGAVLNQYTEVLDERILINTTTTSNKKNFLNANKKDISLEDLESIKSKYIFLGDYHRHQILSVKNSIAMYTGSIERTDMSESDQIKGYIVYDDDNEIIDNYGKARFIEYPKCRPMIEVRGNSNDIMKAVEELPTTGVRGAIVKISFVGSSNELQEFSMDLDTIKKTLTSKVNPIYMFSQQKELDEEDDEIASEVERDILEKGHLNDELVLAAVKEMIVEKESEESEQIAIYDIAVEIYKETLG